MGKGNERLKVCVCVVCEGMYMLEREKEREKGFFSLLVCGERNEEQQQGEEGFCKQEVGWVEGTYMVDMINTRVN